MNVTTKMQLRQGWISGLACCLAIGCASDLDGGNKPDPSNLGSDDPAASEAITAEAVPVNSASAGLEVGPDGVWGEAPTSSTLLEVEAMEWVNYVRNQAGLPYLELIPELSGASNTHADFIIEHYSHYTSTGLTLHEQVAGKDGFSGTKYWERIEAAGYDGEALAEVIAYQPLVAASVMGWIDSVYHRLPLTHPQAVSLGYGAATNGDVTISVMELGKVETPRVLEPVAFPPNGAIDVPVEWDGKEIPQPPQPSTGYPSGPVFTLQFPGEADLVVERTALKRHSETEVAHVMLEPKTDDNLFGQPVVVVYANDPLEPDTKYEVNVTGKYDGQPFDWTSSFTTTGQVGCDLFKQDCRVGQGCFTVNEQPTCTWAGPVPVGGACIAQNDCGPGATCVLNTCRQVCDALDLEGPNGCVTRCQEDYALVSATGDLGACNPLPCSPLTASCGGSDHCIADTVFTCGQPGEGLLGASCLTSADCAAGHACASHSGKTTCQPLCNASPLAGEKIDPLGNEAALPACTSTCPESAVIHPSYPDVGLCL